jgi:hypothetical protein
MSRVCRIFESVRNIGIMIMITIIIVAIFQNQVAIEQNDRALKKLNGLILLMLDIDEDTELIKHKVGISRDDPNDHIKVTFNDTMINIDNKTFLPINESK